MQHTKEKPQKYEDFQMKYVYTPLGTTSLGSTELYHIYGVIQDASIPYVKNRPTCQIRLIDQTLNIKAAAIFDTQVQKTQTKGFAPQKKAQTYIPVQFFANETSSLPHIVHVGDIIRLHRVQISNFRGVK